MNYSKEDLQELLLKSKSFKEFFESVGEYFDKWSSEYNRIIAADKEIGRQNSVLFIKNKKNEEKIVELENLLKERTAFKSEEKPIVKGNEARIIQLDKEDIPDRNERYTAAETARFFLIQTQNASYYFSKGVFQIDEDFLAVGASVADYFVKHNPNLEVFYRISDIKETGNYCGIQLKKGYTDFLLKNECVRYRRLVRYTYITHSALLRLGLELEEETPSYERFLKYTKKTSVVKHNQNPSPEIKTEITTETEKTYTISEFAEKFFLDKKVVKKHLKALLGLSPASCFPAGFTVPKDFVKDFIRLTNPQREPFYPIDAFSNNINLKQLESFCYAIGRYFVLNQRKFFYVLQSDVKTYDLSFITGTYHKHVWEMNEKKNNKDNVE